MLVDVLAGGIWTYDSAPDARLNGFRSEERGDCFHICTTRITSFSFTVFSVQIYVLLHTYYMLEGQRQVIQPANCQKQKILPANYSVCEKLNISSSHRHFGVKRRILPEGPGQLLKGADDRHGEHLPMSRNCYNGQVDSDAQKHRLKTHCCMHKQKRVDGTKSLEVAVSTQGNTRGQAKRFGQAMTVQQRLLSGAVFLKGQCKRGAVVLADKGE